MSQALTPKSAASGLGHMQALTELAAMVRTNAYVMAYSDCSFVMGIALLLIVSGLLLLRKQPSSPVATR